HTRSYGDWSSDVCSSDLVDLLLAHQLRDALDEARFVHLVGELGHHDRLAIAPADVLDADPRAHRQAPPPGAIGGGDLLRAVDDEIGRASCRERVEIGEGA